MPTLQTPLPEPCLLHWLYRREQCAKIVLNLERHPAEAATAN